MKGFVISLILHLSVLFAAFFQWPTGDAMATDPETEVKLFVPADASTEESPPPERKGQGEPVPRVSAAPKPQRKPKLELSTVQLTIEDDIHGDMPVVLKRYSGKIVILNSATNAIQQAYWAVNAKPAPGITIADGLAIFLSDPTFWPDVMALVDSGKSDIVVCALFPPDFAQALVSAIQRKAAEQGIVDIKGAIFAFSSHEASGIVVRKVV
jgi:hypothetical protein